MTIQKKKKVTKKPAYVWIAVRNAGDRARAPLLLQVFKDKKQCYKRVAGWALFLAQTKPPVSSVMRTAFEKGQWAAVLDEYTSHVRPWTGVWLSVNKEPVG